MNIAYRAKYFNCIFCSLQYNIFELLFTLGESVSADNPQGRDSEKYETHSEGKEILVLLTLDLNKAFYLIVNPVNTSQTFIHSYVYTCSISKAKDT